MRPGTKDLLNLVAKYPFADIYQLQSQYLQQLTTELVFGRQK